MRERFSTALLALFLLTLAGCSALGSGAQQLNNVDGQGLGIGGYDPVSYFPEGGGQPQKGDPALTAEHEGISYHFASEENRARFESSPERFAPAYGGWCAWAMVNGDRVGIDPRSFLIEDGKLLLFYDGLFADTRASWREANSPTLGDEADSHWATIVREASVQE